MQKVLNNNMMAIVAVMLLIGFSAFKVAERSTQPEDGWYELYIDSDIQSEYDDQSNQFINSNTTSTPDGVNCDVSNSKKPCMAYLIFPANYTGPLLNETVEELVLNHGVTLGLSPYARRFN